MSLEFSKAKTSSIICEVVFSIAQTSIVFLKGWNHLDDQTAGPHAVELVQL